MKQTILDLVTSKKFLAALAAILVWIAGRFGFDLDPGALDRIFAALLVYVGAQGIADAGKSAALIHDARAATFGIHDARAATFGMPPAGLESGLAPSSGAGAGLLVAVLALAGSSQLSCATVKPLVTNAKTAVVDCVHADQGPIEALLGELAWDGIEAAAKLGAPDWNALVAAAEARGVVIGGCAFVAFTRASRPASSLGVAVSAVATPPPAPDPAAAALERLRAAFGGARWQTASGVL